jgi:hypothetical protein
MSESQYGVRVATSKSGSVYIAGLYGKNGVAQKLKSMGLERNEFQKWVKQAALIVAQRATHLAPRDTGRLALSIRGFAGKKITPNNAPARFLFGGVIIAQPRVVGSDSTYGKAVSFGRYYPESGKRTKGNPYMRTARDQTRQAVVKMWNKEIGRWIERNGFDTTGFGG